MTCAQGLLRLLWGGARSWSATGLPKGNRRYGRAIKLCCDLAVFSDVCLLTGKTN